MKVLVTLAYYRRTWYTALFFFYWRILLQGLFH